MRDATKAALRSCPALLICISAAASLAVAQATTPAASTANSDGDLVQSFRDPSAGGRDQQIARVSAARETNKLDLLGMARLCQHPLPGAAVATALHINTN